MQVKLMTQEDRSLLIHPVLLYNPEAVSNYNIPYILYKSDIMR